MTDTLLCIGGPCDGKRLLPAISGSQTFVIYEKSERAIYSRQTLSFGICGVRGSIVYVLVHESLSPQEAFRRLIERYKGDAE
jgi:hypothetical protein